MNSRFRHRIVLLALIVTGPTAQAQVDPIVDSSCAAREKDALIKSNFVGAAHLARGGWDKYLAVSPTDHAGYEVAYGGWDLHGASQWPMPGDYRAEVGRRLHRIRDAANQWQFRLNCYDRYDNCVFFNQTTMRDEPHAHAYVTKGASTMALDEPIDIFFCPTYWEHPSWYKGVDKSNQWSQESIILHEIGHFLRNHTRGADGAGLKDPSDGLMPASARALAASLKDGNDVAMAAALDSAYQAELFWDNDPATTGPVDVDLGLVNIHRRVHAGSS